MDADVNKGFFQDRGCTFGGGVLAEWSADMSNYQAVMML